MRYIDADALRKETERKIKANNEYGRAVVDDEFLDLIDDAFTEDVVEVRHGTWYHGTEHGAVYAKCSVCGRKMNYSCYGYAYCALCGAKMDGKRRIANE